MRFQRNLQEDQQLCITQWKIPAVKGNFKTHLCHLAKVRRFHCLYYFWNIISYRRPNRSLQIYPLFPWWRIMILKIHKSRMQLAIDFYKTSVLFKPAFYKKPSFYIDFFDNCFNEMMAFIFCTGWVKKSKCLTSHQTKAKSSIFEAWFVSGSQHP